MLCQNVKGGVQMRRDDTFTLRVNENERHMIAALSDKLERSQSDVLRLLVREAARERGVWPPKQPERKATQPAAL
jgi:hypothetical protein